LNKIIFVSNDLIFKTKIDSILKTQNLKVGNYTDFNSIDFETFTEPSNLFIIDLEIGNIDFSFISEKKNVFNNKMYLLGYCSHVLTDLMNKAIDAGFDEVVPRSKFVKSLPKLLNNFDKHNK